MEIAAHSMVLARHVAAEGAPSSLLEQTVRLAARISLARGETRIAWSDLRRAAALVREAQRRAA